RPENRQVLAQQQDLAGAARSEELALRAATERAADKLQGIYVAEHEPGSRAPELAPLYAAQAIRNAKGYAWGPLDEEQVQERMQADLEAARRAVVADMQQTAGFLSSMPFRAPYRLSESVK